VLDDLEKELTKMLPDTAGGSRVVGERQGMTMDTKNYVSYHNDDCILTIALLTKNK
jgi:hypothetical protein